jgi:very-short-patch-repair endonuclease
MNWQEQQQQVYKAQQAEKEQQRLEALEQERKRLKVQFSAQRQQVVEQAAAREAQVEAERLLRERQQTDVLQRIAASLKQSDRERYARLKEAHERIRRMHQGRFWMSNDGRNFSDPQELLLWEAWNEDITRKETMPLIPQRPIGRFRVDFAHVESRTVIEIDGQPHHSKRHDRTRDYARQHAIEDLGWTFIRFTGSQVFADPLACVLYIHQRISQKQGGNHE